MTKITNTNSETALVTAPMVHAAIVFSVLFTGCANFSYALQSGYQTAPRQQTRFVSGFDRVDQTATSRWPEVSSSAPVSVGTSLSSYFDSYVRGRVFKLRNLNPQPAEYFDIDRPDIGVTRTWFFAHGLSGKVAWEQTEYHQRQLCNYFYCPLWKLTGDAWSDIEYFYSRQSLSELGVVLGVAALFANTSIDEDFRNWLERQEMTEPHVDCWFNELGNLNYAAAVTIGTLAISHAWQSYSGRETPIAAKLERWSYRTFRSYLVGTPVVLVLQPVIGASRPGESTAGSDWKAFDDNNGVSGHAFVGAVPFLVAANMSDRTLVKAALITGSGLAGYSRLCKDSHYLSQVILGWTVAYLSVQATTKTDRSCTGYRLVPLDLHGFHGLAVEIRR